MSDASAAAFSTNERAERLMGRRLTPDEESGAAPTPVPIDQPCELGFWCPVCRVPPRVGDEYDERLHWSEYWAFLWCSVCDRDYPSALCVRVEADPAESRRGWYAGPEDAVRVYLDTVEGTRCGAAYDPPPDEDGVQPPCDRPAGHDGWHASAVAAWNDDVAASPGERTDEEQR